MAFEVVVLGASGTYPVPGRACSGYLIRNQETEVWIDAGTGTFANLQNQTNFLGIKALVLSHLHLDHILDLYPFYFALRFWPTEPAAFPVYGPRGSEEFLTQMFSTSREPEFRDFGGYLGFDVISSEMELDIGPFHLRFVRTVHPIETLAMRVQAEGRTLVYTADTGPSDQVTALAEGADVLIAEATMKDPNPALAEVHMTASEAGEMAAKARVGRLVVTHVWPRLDAESVLASAGEAFGGETLLARDQLRVEV